MSETAAKVRATAMRLPGVEASGDGAEFRVEGAPFARIDGDTLLLKEDDWTGVAIDGDTDWTLIDDRIARAWELTAPRDLLEAGGR
ncbi:hypothetical protein [Sphingomonas sp. VNH70]|uniref:hypothetical protein n=1 Tax=Sphingomonas silueang TaxID=3156617 RepID=UPI0032B488FC